MQIKRIYPSLTATFAVAALSLVGCSSSQKSGLNIPLPAGVSATTGYTISVFAAAYQAGASTKPDSIIQLGSNVFVGYGDALNPDGTVPGSKPPVQGKTEMIEYDLQGNPVKTFSLPGHNDGLLTFDSHTIWAMSNEDSNAVLTVIDLTAGTQTQYTPTTPLQHGGGLDDMALIQGTVFASASNPTVDANNIVTGAPAVISISLNANGKTFDWAPVLMGDASATNVVGGGVTTLNLTDPDSEAIDPTGRLVLDSQGDAELVFISNPGSLSQTASLLPLTFNTNPEQVDDTRFVPTGTTQFMLFTDTPANLIFRLDGPFKPGDAYSAGQDGLLKLDPTTGDLTSVVSGLQAPHGVLFVTK